MINKKILESKIFLIFIFPFILGCLSSLSFQPLNFTFINFLSLPILFSILLFVKKKTKSKYRKKPFLLNFFFVGYLFGIGFFLAGTYWISNSLTFDENFKYLIPFAVILIPLFLGLFFAVSTLIIGPIIKKDITSIIIFCCVLSFLDYLRGNILTGFPWNLWAYSWSWLPEFLQLLNKTGLYAFNLITIIVFCSPLLLFLKKEKYNLVIFWIVFFGFFSNYIYGSTIINKNQNFIKDHEKNYVNIKVVSPNLELKYNQS